MEGWDDVSFSTNEGEASFSDNVSRTPALDWLCHRCGYGHNSGRAIRCIKCELYRYSEFRWKLWWSIRRRLGW